MVPVSTLGPGRMQETVAPSAGGGCAGGGRCLGPSRGARSQMKEEGTSVVQGSKSEPGYEPEMRVLDKSGNLRGCECRGGIWGVETSGLSQTWI